MAGWCLSQSLRFKRTRHHLSTRSQPLLGKKAPADCRPEAGCVVIRLRTIVIPSVRVRLKNAGTIIFRHTISKISWSSRSVLPKKNGSLFWSKNLQPIWRVKFAGPGEGRKDPAAFAMNKIYCFAERRSGSRHVFCFQFEQVNCLCPLTP